MPEIDLALEKIADLVNDFQRNQSHYKSAQYSEAQARKDFIDKFWIALGWDVNHDRQTNPYEQEVKVERPVAMGATQRRADYAFYLAPSFHDVKFLVEAKKPSADIETSQNYFQLIRYGWNSETPVAVLTDFEQFHILDCRYRPDIETALSRCIAKYHYTDYANREKFDKIYWWFSHEAVADGSIEKRAKELPKPRGKAVQRGLFPGSYQSIDESFLAELDEYRTSLARTFKILNPKFDGETLTELAQRTLDRLVFLRFLEDKGIEGLRIVEHFGDKGTAWEDFIAASRRLDNIYNGIVYKRHDILDDSGFRVDNTAFANICESLAHKNSPYDFNAIPIHILGSIYERFLGKVIVTTAKRAKVEEKPEVRKAGGVYYTPEYIVRYIVQNTVGKLIAGKTPAQIAKMRFADIACGSGSFLLGVFDLLLKYHGQYYNDNPGKTKKGECVKRDDKLFLSLSKKREILLNNIYGVDIDSQAVEVCQLSLYLKLLEEETEASARQYLLDFEHTAQLKQLLPDLSKNIVCGNSLIGRDILDGRLFATDEERKLNPMDFEDVFPDIMKRGGFDAVVGNPPYGALLSEGQKDYLRSKYETATSELDTYSLFMEKAIKLCRPSGRVSMIVPTGWYSGVRFSSFRQHFVCNTDPQLFVNLPYDVFEAWVDTTIFVSVKRPKAVAWPRKAPCAVLLKTFPKRHKIEQIAEFEEGTETAELTSWFAGDSDQFLTYADTTAAQLITKIQSRSKPLKDFADVQRGVTPFNLTEKPDHAHSWRAFDGTVRRYSFDPGKKRFVRFDDSLAEPKPERYFKGHRILLRELISRQFRLQAVKVREDFVTNKSMQSVLPIVGGPDLDYLLGCLNSALMSWYFLRRSNIAQRDDFPKIVLKETRNLPIRPINFSDNVDKASHDKMVTKVDAMLEAKKQLAKAKTDKDKAYYENKCSALDREIDRLVYDLYGLTPEEIKIVEETSVQ